MNHTKYLNREITRLRMMQKNATSDKLKRIIQVQIDKLELAKTEKDYKIQGYSCT